MFRIVLLAAIILNDAGEMANLLQQMGNLGILQPSNVAGNRNKSQFPTVHKKVNKKIIIFNSGHFQKSPLCSCKKLQYFDKFWR